MAAARITSGLAYPDRFHAAAAYAGLEGSPNSAKSTPLKLQGDVFAILYALYKQATVGPCNVSKPYSWNAIELSKWKSWQELGNMASTEAMRLFVKILEEEDPGWYSRASNLVSDTVDDMQNHKSSEIQSISEKKYLVPETKNICSDNGNPMALQDKDVVSEAIEAVNVYDQWVMPPISGQCPKARYEHGAAVVQDKMYVFGGNHNGRYLNDLHVLDLRNWVWSKIDAVIETELQQSQARATLSACAGHTLIPWGTKLLSVAGHANPPCVSIQVNAFDLQNSTWSSLKTYGKAPVSRGGQSICLVGTSLVIFGGQDSNRSLLNDLHILDLETMTWDEFDAIGAPPSPRSDHSAAVHADRYLLIFGGGSHATCFNDLHVFDLQTMEWTRPTQYGEIPAPRAGHAGVTIGDNWYLVGGGDNKSGVSETVVLNMPTLVWSVVTSVQGRTPLASEGLSVVASSYNGEDILVTFGGYNGRYSNQVHVLKPNHKSTTQSKLPDSRVVNSNPSARGSTQTEGHMPSEAGVGPDGKIREIVVDEIDVEKNKTRGATELALAKIRVEKAEMESLLNREKLQTAQLKKELDDAGARNADLYKDVHNLRSQVASEQSRCFKLEVEVAELRRKLQAMEDMQKELEHLQRQRAASEQAVLTAKQRQGSGGVWNWLAGTPPPKE